MSDRITTAPKTWRDLDRQAFADNLRLVRTFGCVTVETTDSMPRAIVTITTEDLDDPDADKVVRRALEGALDALGSLTP